MMIPGGGSGGAAAGEKRATKGGKAKGKGKEQPGIDWQTGVRAVVYRVTESKITLALGGGGDEEDKEELELGDNLRL